MIHRLEYLAVRTLIAVFRITPGWLVRATGALLGYAVYAFDRSRRRIADRNLAAAFPHRAASERRHIVRHVFAHFGRLLAEMLAFSTLSNEEMLAR